MKHLATRLIHSGDGQFQKKVAAGASVPETFPLYLTSVFAFDDVPSVDAIYEKEREGYIYSRIASPNADAVSQILSQADGGEQALVFASGMAAITTSILSFVQAGDHILSSPVLYGGVSDYLANELARFGVEVSFIDFMADDAENHIKPNTKLLYTEMISNPLMEVPDIAAVSEIAHRYGAKLFVDNTFATPAIVRPLELGADLALYSATKYLGGHSDIVSGAVVGKSAVIDTIKRYQVLYGSVAGPLECWLLSRSLRTLDLRMRQHSENARRVAEFLEAHPKVETVFYPGLLSSPSHETARKQFHKNRFGGMLSVNLKGGEAEASRLIEGFDKIPFVPSLAGTATTVSYALKTSHRFYKREERERLGITDNQLRFSIGLEDAEDIIAELERGLEKI